MIDPQVLEKNYGFAIYPNVKLKEKKFNEKTGKESMTFCKELLFGDYIKLIKDSSGQVQTWEAGKKTYVKVRSRRADGWVETHEIQPDRILEVNFVDIGQGDGCHLVTPDDDHFIIDAGKGDNMYRFLSWRFNLRNPKNRPPKVTGVITHSDSDHYGGFSQLFKAERDGQKLFAFDKVYHNGLVEESGETPESLGTTISENGKKYVNGLVKNTDELSTRISNATKTGAYLNMLKECVAPVESVSTETGRLIANHNYKIEVLGPITEKINGKAALRVFDEDKGRTKNGHSVILKLTIGKLRLLLGGDLNSSSENYLFEKVTGADMGALNKTLRDPDRTNAEKKAAQGKIDEAVLKMREMFQVDITKSCHHGSADFTHDFLKAINPIATIISSGDNESYCHPRPDTLGTIGKYSRGERSLIFSTELARSGKEFITLSELSATKKNERLVVVYGMINVRTDGEKVIIAQKLEKAGASKNWDIHRLIWDEKTGEFVYVDYLEGGE